MKLLRWIVLLLGALLVGALPVGGYVVRAQSIDRPDDRARFDTVVRPVSETPGGDCCATTAAYLTLLKSLDQHPHEAEAAVLLKQHLRALAVLLPEALHEEIGIGRVLEANDWSVLKPGSGTRLVQWWRSQDILPATARHERLEEHLQRVAHVYRHFRRENDALAFDERGMIYIRLGPPGRMVPITFEGVDFSNKVLNRDPSITLSSFPAGEFWVYGHIDDAAQYLFVREAGRGYRIGESYDLIPRSLRMGLGPTGRGRNKGIVLTRVMKEIYRQLAHLHTQYASRYADLADYNELLDNVEFAIRSQHLGIRGNATQSERGESAPDSDVASGFEQSNVSGGALSLFLAQLPVQPHVFAQNMVMEGRSEDLMTRHQRETTVSRAYSGVYGLAENLPVALRWSRFLNDDGTTRTELYWSVRADALEPSKALRQVLQKQGVQPQAHYLINRTLVQQTASYQDRVIDVKRSLVPVSSTSEAEVLPAQTIVAESDTATYHLALQWDAYWASLSGDEAQTVQPGVRLKIGSYRVDTLQALSNDPQILEMSDLKPLLMTEEVASMEAAPPYPHAALTPETRLALYFEVYHLNFGPDDRTRYSVEYEVARRKNRAEGAKPRPGEEQTLVSTEYRGTSRIAREHVLLDLSAWGGSGALTVTVRVTDVVTGQQIERSLPFQLIKES